jgi:uncharacterized protein YceH (UPF0502 family)
VTILTEIEVRVLGSLIEKHITTPEYYPHTEDDVWNENARTESL